LYVTDDKGFIPQRRVGRRENGGLNSKDRAIMLMKKNVEKMSVYGLAIISMKTRGLFCPCHYVYENK
jgi:hypothetical protein